MTKKIEIRHKAWLLVASLSNWKIAEQRGMFGIHGNNGLLDKIEKEDKFAAYVPEIGFIGTGKIKGTYFVSNILLWSDKTYRHRFQISSPFISNKVLPAPSIVDDLSFVTNKQKYGVFFKSGIREIPLEDFELIFKRFSNSVPILDKIDSDKLTKKPIDIGNNLHDRVLRLFQNLGFVILENNYFRPGPDIKIVDPEALSTNKILIQCKNSEQEDITFSNLDQILNEYSGRLKTEDANVAILVISGYKLPSKIPGDKEKVKIDELLRKYGVAIWTIENLEYYEDLISKISHFARYQVLSDLGLKLEFSENLSKRAVKIVQNGYTMFATSLRPDWLLKSASVVRRIRLSDGIKGYQRLLDRNRVVNSSKASSISNYLDINDKWIFPNAIVLASSRDFPLRYDKEKLELKSRYGQFWVIDGQHRLFAFANTESRKLDNELMCVIVDSKSLGSIQEQERGLAQIFVTLNGRAKRVPKSLLYELYELLGSDDDKPLEVVLKLVKDDFFADCIKGYSDKEGSINLVAFADAKGTESIYKYFKANSKKSESEVVNITAVFILESFKELAKHFSSEWNNPDMYFLKTDRGVKGILELLSKVIKGYGPKIEDVSRVFKALKESEFDFLSETAKGLYLGAGGPERLATLLSKHISKTIVDFAPELSSRRQVDLSLESRKGEIISDLDDFLKRWLGTLEGEVRCSMMFIDPTTIKYLRYLNKNKVKQIRMFFGNCQESEVKVKEEIKKLRDEGFKIILTQSQKRTVQKGGIFHLRWIGDDKYQIRTEVDLKENSLRGSLFRVSVDTWVNPPEIDDFERYWMAAELNKDIQFGYDWVGA